MTTINSSSPLASYLASASKTTATSAGTQEKASEGSSDPIAELRRMANLMVARSEGGLLRALNGGGSLQSTASTATTGSQTSTGSSGKIQLPDVADMERDDAAKLLEQVNKLIDAGLGDSTSFVGAKDGQQTNSLTTYRDWLQEKGGISIYV
ncbi:hypothetical protein [Pseudomonas sp. ML96]|uniref:hypothetical protein n=1 Tax=Pseudomonadaceae TaxID=135621 RepID=UPI0005BCFCC6|nr:hypothetical protein [Pseudomonas sp. ML96]